MKRLTLIILGSALMIPLLVGCPEHRHTYVYGMYAPSEDVYYSRWETQTRREHRAYEKREKAEQHEYWEWRKHNHN